MRRTFNYTGRKRIPRTAVSIRVYSDGGIRYFDADLNLADSKLPAEAQVFVDAYYERASMRFDFGTVGGLKPAVRRSLDEIDFGKRILFRVKVVDSTTGRGKLIAVADGIVPVDADDAPGAHDSLLPVDPRADMGQELWRVEFDSSGPVLQVNQSVEDVMGLFRNNRVVSSLVYPEVLRVVLARILEDGEESEDVAEPWQQRWFRFGTLLTGAPQPVLDAESRTEDEAQRWIESVVAAFAVKLRARDAFAEAVAEGRV